MPLQRLPTRLNLILLSASARPHLRHLGSAAGHGGRREATPGGQLWPASFHGAPCILGAPEWSPGVCLLFGPPCPSLSEWEGPFPGEASRADRRASHSPSPGKDSQLSRHGCFHSGLQVAASANRTQSSSEAARSLPSLRGTTPGHLMRPSGTLVLPRQMCLADQARQC